MEKQKQLIMAAALLGASSFTHGDTVIPDDLIIQGSACVGATCADGTEFGFDTIRLQSDSPQIHFNDTSSSSAFPSTDWRVGVSGGVSALPAAFFIMNATSGIPVLQISPEGDVALGAGAQPVAGAVSMGAVGNGRRVTHVADGIDDNDAVTLGQFNSHVASMDTTDIDAQVQNLQNRIDDLSARLSALAEDE